MISRALIYLLKNRAMTSPQATAIGLDSLTLDQYSLLEPSDLSYVEQSSFAVGFNPSGDSGGEGIAKAVLREVGKPALEGLPFVVEADGARIYLGSFTNPISSLPAVGPTIDVSSITPRGFTIRPPYGGTDPRFDQRILQVLTDTVTLIL